MLNKIILLGNIGRTPKVGIDQNGREIATFSLATNTSWKATTGEWQKHTDWHHIIVFRESTVRWIKEIFKKGDTVYVIGRLTYHQWTDPYNQTQTTPSIVISGFEGIVEHIRSNKPNPSAKKAEEQDNSFQENNFQEKDFEENAPFREDSHIDQDLQDPQVFEDDLSKDEKSKIRNTVEGA